MTFFMSFGIAASVSKISAEAVNQVFSSLPGILTVLPILFNVFHIHTKTLK